MGVDAELTLPPMVQVRWVGKAIARLLDSDHYDLIDIGVQGLCGINVDCNLPLHEGCPLYIPDRKTFNYHFEFGNRGERGLKLKANTLNIAVFDKLAKIFGGKVDVNDCDEVEVNMVYAIPHVVFNFKETDDEAFNRLMEHIEQLKPIPIFLLRDKYQDFSVYEKGKAWT